MSGITHVELPHIAVVLKTMVLPEPALRIALRRSPAFPFPVPGGLVKDPGVPAFESVSSETTTAPENETVNGCAALVPAGVVTVTLLDPANAEGSMKKLTDSVVGLVTVA